MKKVTVIGGGNGSAISINALKHHQDLFEISAVASMSDSGGSTGRLREEFNTLPPGDIMRAILAMSPYDQQTLKKIFHRNRFSETGKLDRHNLGNLFLVLAEQYTGDYISAVRALEQSLDAVGKVYPATLDKNDLLAELSNGKVIKTEGAIDRPNYDRSLRIKKVWLEPEAKIYQSAKEAIEKADAIVMGPGSLYTSIVATLLPKGVKEAIGKSKAKLIYVTGSIYEKGGETGPEKLSEFVKGLQEYLPRKIDQVVYNVHELNKKEEEKYKQKNWGTFPNDQENIPDYDVVVEEYEKPVGVFCYKKLGSILKRLIYGV